MTIKKWQSCLWRRPVILRALGLLLTLSGGSEAWAKIFPVTDYDNAPYKVFSVEGMAPDSWILERNFDSQSSYFEEKQSFIDSKQSLISVDVSMLTDWDDILSLNDQAIVLSRQLYDCAEGKPPQMRQIYRDGNLCRGFRASLDLFRQQVLGTMVSSTSRLFKFAQNIRCENLQRYTRMQEYCDHYYQSYLDKMKLLYTYSYATFQRQYFWLSDPAHKESQDSSGELQPPFPAEFFEHIHWPKFHPLFVQVLLEVAAQGYLLPYGDWDCGGFLCGINMVFTRLPHKMAFEAPGAGWTLRGRKSNKKNEKAISVADHWAKLSLNEGLLPDYSDRNTELELFQLNRAALTALRILYLNAVFGQREASMWGLWPEQSFDLINTMAISYMRVDGKEITNNLPDRLLFWMAFSIDKNPVGGLLGPGTREVPLIMRLADVGAWRRLWGEPTKMGAPVDDSGPSDQNVFGPLGGYDD